MAGNSRSRLSVTVTFDDQADWELLERHAEDAGISRSALARQLLSESLRAGIKVPAPEDSDGSLIALEDRLDALHRTVAQGAFMVLTALELHAGGRSSDVPEAREWVTEKLLADT